jgi:DNA-binding transcriptional LysR family regulator
MTNIPTDLLRTYVLVAELRSFTRAAKAQGMTQPAVSAQIRRLQCLLGVELFDKSAPGVSLTSMGEQVIDSARRLLSVNDHIVEIADPNATTQLVRIGLRKDCMGEELAEILAASCSQWPNLRFNVLGAGQRRLLQHLRQDEVDLVVTLLPEAPEAARHYWTEELAWVRGEAMALDLRRRVPLISYGERCVCHRIAMTTLNKAGLEGELVFRANTAEALRSAVAAGVGIMLMPRSRIPRELGICDDGPLPPAPAVYSGVFVREGTANATIDQLADRFADILRPVATASHAVRFGAPRVAAMKAARRLA